MRFSPETSRQEAKRVIALILDESGGEFFGMTKLYKAFYMAHLYYWEAHSGVLTKHPIVRMPHGPGIDRGPELLLEMCESGTIEVSNRPQGPFSESVYRLLVQSAAEGSAEERASIRRALDFISTKSAAALSAETHEFSRTWQQSADGEEMDIYLDLLTDQEYDANRRSLGEVRTAVDDIFGR